MIIILILLIYIFSDILEKEVDDLDNDSTRKAKHFYQACMNLCRL